MKRTLLIWTALLALPAVAGAATASLVTYLQPDTDAAAPSASPRQLTALGNKLFFVIDKDSTSFELWGTDGATAGTRLVSAQVLLGGILGKFRGALLFLARGD